jgi:hypothetical protein
VAGEDEAERAKPSDEGGGGGKLGRRLAVGVVMLVVLASLLVRAWLDGRAQLREADAMAELGDLDGEIRHLGRAARWRLPVAEHDELARARLLEIAERETAAGHVGVALVAMRELRSAILATRTIDVVDPELLEAANVEIVTLMVLEANEAGRTADGARWAAELDEDTSASEGGGHGRGRSLIAAACFAAWLVACVGFFVRGIDGKGRLEPRLALRWGVAMLVLLVGWLALL